ncbi:hypothetical protein BBJ28_00014344 [Nothophytophthora sp. Chile5]|nr:hypothetical protein BBJ28_00014344 [Nothophytophthora sp. Chile5]
MDGGASGGRGGGGRGKGKKGKAARSKKAVAAAAASTASSGREKDSSVPHGGKKLGATHGNGQPPPVQPTASPVGPRAANAGVKDTSTSGAAQPQTQSKRKRKKAKSKAGNAAGVVLKQQTGKQPAAESEEKPAAKAKIAQPHAVQAVSVPLKRGVTLGSPKTAAVKPHIVSLTGTKKRKKRAGKTATGATAASNANAGGAASPATAGAPLVKKVQAAAKAKLEKKPSGVINLPVASPRATASGTSAKPTAATLKRKIAQVPITSVGGNNEDVPSASQATVEEDRKESANSDRPLVKFAGSTTVEPSKEDKKLMHEMPPPQQVSAVSSVVGTSKKQPEGILKLEAVPAVTSKEATQSQSSHEVEPLVEKVNEGSVASPPASSSSHNSVENLGIIMDSHAYVAKMMKSESEGDTQSGRDDGERSPLKVALSPRPENAWGATFGTSGSAPIRVASSPSPVLSTTPLSSWFLSKGSANFVKHVHFSDDDEEDDDVRRRISHEGGSASSPTRDRHLHSTSSKGKATSAKNAFLESLAAQSSWRSWYGDVDLHNLLDPPLAHIPDKLRAYEAKSLALPEVETGSEDRASDKTKSELEVLEADIRREKQRGSAFSEQLLLMLQGKTASGKLLEEEYRPLLQH